jgi:diguanylate cyclase (GGDEF)-like protein
VTVAPLRHRTSAAQARRSLTDQPARVLIVLGVLVIPLYLLGLPSQLEAVVANILFVSVASIASLLSLRTARRLGQAGLPWRLIGLGCLLWAAGQAVWAVYELGLGDQPPYPSLADFGYLGLYPFLIAGLVIIVRREMEEVPAVELVLDSAIVMAVAGTILFQFTMPPVLASLEYSVLAQVVAVGWQVGTFGLLLLTAIALIWRPRQLGRNPLSALMAGLLLFTIANLVYGHLMLADSYYSGHLIDLGWIEGFLFIGVAAQLAGRAGWQSASDLRVRAYRQATHVRTALILLSIGVVAWLAARAAFSDESHRVVGIAIAGVGLLLMARLGHSAWESEQLERRTRERDRLAGVVAASAAIAASLELDDLLPRLASAAASAVGRARVEVYVYDEARTRVAATGYFGLTPEEMLALESVSSLPVGAFQSVRQIHGTPQPVVQWTAGADLPPSLEQTYRDIGKEKVLVAPLLAHGAVIGVISLWTPYDTHPFAPADIAAAAAIGQQAGLAVYNARLLAQARQHVAEQAALLRVSQVAIARLDFQTLVNEIASASLGIANAECCGIEIWHRESRETEMIAQAYVDDWSGPDNIGTLYALDHWPSTERALTERLPLNARVADPIITDHEREIFLAAGTRAVLVVPLVLGEEALGILSLFSRTDALFTEAEVRVGQELAAQASLAIDRARMDDALRERADTDGLTGVLNRRAILEIVDRELVRAGRAADSFAIAMLDLDGFKQVNDVHGHHSGDEVLTATAALLRRSVRDFDHVGRYGGDEFLLVLPGVDRARAEQITWRLADQFQRRTFAAGEAALQLGISTGIAVYPHDAVTRHDLLQQADQAMYADKKAHGSATLRDDLPDAVDSVPAPTYD